MEEKRRLPSWMMVGASTANKVSKPLDADASSVVTSDEMRVVTKVIKPKAKGVTRNHKKEVCVPSDKKLLVCERKRKKRRMVERDVVECHDPDPDPDREVNIEKRRDKRKVEEPEPSRKKSEKSFEFDSGSETQGLSCDEEDDDDLTMEDVLSIAREFVENDKRDTGQQKASEVESELCSKSPYARSPMHAETDSHHEPVETTSETTLADFKMTADPAQDMLDLFLGDLLKKPIAKVETISTNDFIIPHETKTQQHAAAVPDKPVTLTKKKCSLRDTVAMLLD